MKKYLRITIYFLIAIVLLLGLILMLIDNGLFNMIPYSIHNSYFNEVIGENIFIKIFRIIFFSLICFITYKLYNEIKRVKKYN